MSKQPKVLSLPFNVVYIGCQGERYWPYGREEIPYWLTKELAAFSGSKKMKKLVYNNNAVAGKAVAGSTVADSAGSSVKYEPVSTCSEPANTLYTPASTCFDLDDAGPPLNTPGARIPQ
nr:hypothetical protein Iba_chr13cCG15040 [Ipomoea batatas]